jgi:hypothetical protein
MGGLPFKIVDFYGKGAFFGTLTGCNLPDLQALFILPEMGKFFIFSLLFPPFCDNLQLTFANL